MKKIGTHGFTLLETLLAIGILAVLMAALVNYLQKEEQKNTTSLAATQVNTILNAAVQYQTTYVTWPSSLSALIPFNNAISLSSPWRNSTGINDYTLTSTPTSHYFSIQVAVPSTTVAQQLISAIPNGYFSVNGNEVLVTAYTTAFIRPDYPPHPTGVLYGNTATATTPNPSSSFPTLSYLLFPSLNSSILGPFGIINVIGQAEKNRNQKPKNYSNNQTFTTYFSQNYTPLSGYSDAPVGTTFTSGTESPICPNGSIATSIILPVTLRPQKTGWVSYMQTAGFGSIYMHLTSLGGGKIDACINEGFPLYNGKSTNPDQMDTNIGFISDIVCLPNDSVALNRWPDVTFSGTYCPPTAGGF